MKISNIIKENKNSIILIDIFIPDEKEPKKGKISIRGTGFIVSPDGKFITCAHLYKQIPKNELSYLGARVSGRTDEKGVTHYDRYKIKLLEMDEKNDIALMQIISEDENRNFTPIKKFGDAESVEEGDEVVFMGYPLATELLAMKFGITMSTNHCIISSVKRRGIDGSLHFFMIDTHTNNGSSGSPVFSKETGDLIGVVSGRISMKIQSPEKKVLGDIPSNMGICRPIKYVIDLINR